MPGTVITPQNHDLLKLGLDFPRTHPNWGRLRIHEELRDCGHDLDEPEVNYVLDQYNLPNLHL
jgi:hypothetical protein